LDRQDARLAVLPIKTALLVFRVDLREPQHFAAKCPRYSRAEIRWLPGADACSGWQNSGRDRGGFA
jgi:hypothetical protein